MAWPAVLAGRTAIQAGLRREPTGVIELVVEPGRKVVAPAGFSVVRRTGLVRRASWNLSPPRLRIEDAALDVAAALGESYVAVETLAEVCRERAATPDRLLDALQARGKIAHRRFLRDALYDVRDGATSVLERGDSSSSAHTPCRVPADRSASDSTAWSRSATPTMRRTEW